MQHNGASKFSGWPEYQLPKTVTYTHTGMASRGCLHPQHTYSTDQNPIKVYEN